MEHGITVGTMVSIAWIVLQNLAMHVRPVVDRFKVMVVGYLLSLPFVFLGCRWIPPVVPDTGAAMVWFHAYFFHLLLFMFYVQCFYHIERSVTFRLLVEILKSGQDGLPLPALQSQYSVDEMIKQRLEVLRQNGFLDKRGDGWTLRPKGRLLARVTLALSWVFQSKGQHERL